MISSKCIRCFTLFILHSVCGLWALSTWSCVTHQPTMLLLLQGMSLMLSWAYVIVMVQGGLGS